ncbi:AT-rich interactive domain-containing protein 2 isoform X9 [Cephus cinctus]|uniref:AT-rich interactive domain-containing protein 2 isoform X9 n=1 Tax=Cephus cinctus TaxID=211228 RepID=A0AAJ7RHV3_CEPCN|nr:AT-rich interactive domain-containing protein 2 isoform X9 [Cephus cinctus]
MCSNTRLPCAPPSSDVLLCPVNPERTTLTSSTPTRSLTPWPEHGQDPQQGPRHLRAGTRRFPTGTPPLPRDTRTPPAMHPDVHLSRPRTSLRFTNIPLRIASSTEPSLLTRKLLGTQFKKSPKISGNQIDLYLLYVLVTAHGGWIKVNTRNEWSALCEQFHLPSGCVNSGVGLKQIYLRYLDRYEKVHFLGEDGQQADDDDEDSRHRKWSARALHSIPLTYNHHQHNVAESLRDYNGLSADLYKPSNYDKLALSLLSPLPNEQDFAINVCTLLSNEGKHTLRLDKYPRLVNILLAHAGVFDSPGTRQLFIEVYSRVRNYSINSFWSDVLDSQDVIDLTDERSFMRKAHTAPHTFSRRKTLEKEKQSKANGLQDPDVAPMDVDGVSIDCSRLEEDGSQQDESEKDQKLSSIKFEDEDRELFCVGRTLGTQDPYGQRVLQIASILRNLSFTPENAVVLGRNRCFLRFVLLCVRSRWSNLHQLGFDLLGNVASEIILKEAGERITDVVLSCVAKGIDSQDRFIVISCLEVLNKVSQQDSNEEIVTFGLDDSVYEIICRFLALSDIALLVYTLECLYALTSLGERPCTSVARVRGAIDTLVALVTVEAQSYGPKACILMRVVETVSTVATPATHVQSVAVSAPAAPVASVAVSVSSAPTTVTASPAPVSPSPSRPTTPAATVAKSTTHKAVETANSIQQQHAHQQIIQENEQFALGWLRATFELAPGVRIEQEELYKKYLGCCTKIGRRGVIAPLHFPRCVRSVFGGTVGPNPIKGETSGSQYYEGIRVRATPSPVTYPGQTAIGVNTTSISTINTTPVKVAQRQQQQRLLQQQLTGVIQPAAPAATPATATNPRGPPVNSKHKPAIAPTPAKKIQRLNGAKVIVTNNCDKTEVNDNENMNQTVTSTTVMSNSTGNHTSSTIKVCRPPPLAPLSAGNKINQRTVCTPIAEDSDSTNNSLASSSGIGGSRDCSGVGAEEENSLTSFEGILLNGAPSNLDIDAQDDGSSKDSSSLSSKEKPVQSMMLADLLEKKVDKEPIMNGVLGKNSVNEKGMDLVENHIEKVLKESPTEMKIKSEMEENSVRQTEVSEDTLIEAPRGMKRTASESDEVDAKKPKYSNGTTSPDPAVDSTTVESTVSSLKSEDQDDDKDSEKATVSSTAANLYAALAADCIEDETDLDEQVAVSKEEPPAVTKEEPPTFIAQVEQQQQQHHQQHQHHQPQHQHQHQQQLIVAAPRQIVVQQTLQPNNQVIIPTAPVKGRQPQPQPQVLLQQSAGGQLQYVVSGGVPGQNYVLAQPQTALVQGQAQTVLVAQTTQQQGTGAKTIIILQPQSAAQPSPQKMVAVTPQGQQVVVTQVQRPILQSPALGNIPPPLVPTSATIPQTSIIVNSSVAQTNPNAMTVTIPAMAQQSSITTSVPSRVVTPTPASTPPPTRPTTPHQAASTHGLNIKQQPIKVMKTVNSSTSMELESKPSTSQQTAESKTITIKIDPNAFLCEWRGCLRQFKTAHEVYLHVCEVHCPTGGEEILCLWASCDGLKRRRFSLMTHLYDRHCNSEIMSVRRKQLTVTGKTEISTSTPPTPHHPGYAPNAAFHAIKRHALEFVNPKELMQRPTKPAAATSSSSSPRPGQNPPPEQDDNEGPVTKSIRLTAALILRNLVIYSAHGRRHLRAYEPHLAGVALSNVESSRTIAQVLYDMNDQSNSSHR